MDSSEHPPSENEKDHALKNEAHVDDLPETQSFSGQEVANSLNKEGSSTTTSKPQEPEAPLEDAGTVVSQEPPLEIKRWNETDTSTTKIGTGKAPPSDLTSMDGENPVINVPITPGMVLGHYKITKFIGGGGMGRVYLGIDQSLDRKVAIKVLHRQRAQDHFSVARFMNEAKSAARLNHEHIAQVYFAGQEGDIPFIAFEFVEGTNIRTIVETQGVFSLPQAIMYLIQITHALAHASHHGVIHRDVKPSNILITHEGRAKLIDMGLARLLKPTDPGDDLTASGVTLGTFDYISPEQARDPRNADIRSDIYSLGCTFFFMLTGRPPFHEGTVLQKLLQHQGDEPPDIRELIPGIPVEVTLILQKMMKKDPRQRFQSPVALLAELTQVAGMIGLRPSGPGNAIWTMNDVRKKPLLLSHLPWIAGILLFGISIFFLNWTGYEQKFLMPTVNPSVPLREHPEPTDTKEITQNTPAQNVTGNEKIASKSLIYQLWTPSSPYRRDTQDVDSLDANATQFSTGASYQYSTSSSEEGNADTSPTQRIFGQKSTVSIRKAAGFGVPLMNASLYNRKNLSDSSRTASIALPLMKKGTDAFEKSPSSAPTLLFVDPTQANSDERIYANLSTAIAAAGKNATIELRFNGTSNLKTEPISLVGKQLTIQAGAGYSPVLYFEPDFSVIKSGRVFLFLINGGNVRFHKVAFEIDVPSKFRVTKMSLFELPGEGQLTFSDCSITLRNMTQKTMVPILNGVSIFRIANPTDSDSSLSASGFSHYTASHYAPDSTEYTTPLASASDSAASSRNKDSTIPSLPSTELGGSDSRTEIAGPYSPFPATEREEENEIYENQITLENCVFRGETKILTVESNRSVRLNVNNAFFATEFQFLHERAVVPRESENERKNRIAISLEHVTLFCRSKLIRLEKDDIRSPLPVKFATKNSIFRLNQKPICEFTGFTNQEETEGFFEWSGETNFFQNVSSFAEIKDNSPDAPYPVDAFLSHWKSQWDSPPTTDATVLTNLDTKPTHQMTPSESTVPSWPPNNPAHQAVQKSENEKIDAGQIFELLPRVSNRSGR